MVGEDQVPDVGTKVRVKASSWNGPVEHEGILLAASSEGHLTLKLINGYNISHRLDAVASIKSLASPSPSVSTDGVVSEEDDSLPIVHILHTGGTIASKVDYETGAVTARFEPEEILSAVPELAQVARIRTKKLGNMWSDDIRTRHWNRMAAASAEAFEEGADGVVITHGTDTMHLSSAALAFAFSGKGGRPAGRIAFTGSQRSSDRGSSDGAENLIAAVHWAGHGPTPTGERDSTVIIMHAGSDDGIMEVISGCAARKNHSSRRDAFSSINQAPIGHVSVSREGRDITLTDDYSSAVVEQREICSAPTEFSESVRVLQLIAGSQLFADQIEHASDAGYDAILFHGTGLGHLPLDDPNDAPENADVKQALNSYIASGGIAVITTQCIHGPVHLDVYSKGRDQQEMGVVGHGSNTSPEAALVKLLHLLSRDLESDEFAQSWSENLVGENPTDL